MFPDVLARLAQHFDVTSNQDNANWGPAELEQRLAEAWQAFMRPVTDPLHPWLRVVHGEGRDAVEAVYAALLDGRSLPQQGHMLAL